SISIARLNFIGSGSSKTFILDVGANTLTISGTTLLDVTSGNGSTNLNLGVNGGTNAGVIDFGGNVTVGTSVVSPSAGFIGNANSKLIFRSNVTFGAIGYVNASRPGTVQFDGSGTQTLTYNNGGAASFNNIIVGFVNNPTLVLAGTATAANMAVVGNITVNGSSVLDLNNLAWNRTAVGGTFTMNNT